MLNTTILKFLCRKICCSHKIWTKFQRKLCRAFAAFFTYLMWRKSWVGFMNFHRGNKTKFCFLGLIWLPLCDSKEIEVSSLNFSNVIYFNSHPLTSVVLLVQLPHTPFTTFFLLLLFSEFAACVANDNQRYESKDNLTCI